jgi:hypothetical protein
LEVQVTETPVGEAGALIRVVNEAVEEAVAPAEFTAMILR